MLAQISDSPVEVANTPPLYRVTTSKHYVIEKLSPGTKRVLKTVEADVQFFLFFVDFLDLMGYVLA